MSIFSRLDTIEYPLIQALQNLDGTILDSFSRSVSNIPLMLVFFSIVIAFLIVRKDKLWKPLLFAVITSALISYSINEWFFKMLLSEIGIFRPRPWTIHPDILAIGHTFRDSSFPSSHMAFTTLLVIIVSYFEKKFLKYRSDGALTSTQWHALSERCPHWDDHGGDLCIFLTLSYEEIQAREKTLVGKTLL
jgi:membrane-associated phospholipid phosphatase